MRRYRAIGPAAALGFLGLCALAPTFRAPALAGNPATPSITVAESVVDGSNPGIKVTGLRPNEVVRVHALRALEKWQNEGEKWQRVRQVLHAYADFAAAADGSVQVATQAPVKGSYTRADPLALLRTGYPPGDPALAGVRTFPREPLEAGPESRVWLKLERAGAVVAEAAFDLLGAAPGVTVSQKFGDGWHVVYARPADGKNLPAVISLHGSEGGSVEKARGRALPFASQGFAAVAVNYFADTHEAVKGVPTRHAEIKLEILEGVRNWLKTRPEVDPSRLHLYGVSKGAEFALLAAARYDWVTSAVAVVPSDVVWEGYSEDRGKGAASSSWSSGGRPVPFVPLFPFDPKQEGLYRTNTERYERSRAFHADRVAAARIPVEATNARLLLLASDRDEVWASGAMARNLAERLTAAGKGDRVEVKIYPRAGHQITGTGTFPVRLYGVQSADPDAKDIVAEGEAAADAWRRTLRFLKK